MRKRLSLLILLFLSSCLFADDQTERVEYTLKSPRTREPVLGGSKEKVFFSITIPDSVKTVRGAICNPFSKDEPVSKHWRAACKHWGFAYLQVDFDAVKKEEFVLIKTALTDLAKQTKHPELENIPLCFTGMSRGGGMSMNLTEMMPERTICSVPVCLEVGPESEATRRIPVLTVFGEKDGSQMEKLLGKLPVARKSEAHWGLAVQWNRKHEFGQANNLSFVFMEDVIAKRVPKEGAKLTEIPLEEGWLADLETWSKDGKIPNVSSWKDYKGDRTKASWFPSERVAMTWRSFVASTKEITIAEPLGLGDGQAFTLHSPTKAIPVKLTLAASLKPKKVELWDAHQRLAEKTEGAWNFEVTLKPGIRALYAVVYQEGAEPKLSRPHTIVVGE